MLRRPIEVALPVEEVSEQSARETSIRHGHVSTLRIWWARRPLAGSSLGTIATRPRAAADRKHPARLAIRAWFRAIGHGPGQITLAVRSLPPYA